MPAITNGSQFQLDNAENRADRCRLVSAVLLPCSLVRRMQDRKLDTGYDTRRRAPGGALAHRLIGAARVSTADGSPSLAVPCDALQAPAPRDLSSPSGFPPVRQCPSIWRGDRMRSFSYPSILRGARTVMSEHDAFDRVLAAVHGVVARIVTGPSARQSRGTPRVPLWVRAHSSRPSRARTSRSGCRAASNRPSIHRCGRGGR